MTLWSRIAGDRFSVWQVAVDFIYGTSTPDTWIYSPEMQRVIDPLIDIVGWENDIYSFRKVRMCNALSYICLFSDPSLDLQP